jgi:peptidyl-prolyl cis-trans isomerase B (cyclophilin B)
MFMKRGIALLLSIIVMVASFTGCGKEIDQFAEPEKGATVAEIVIKDYGSIFVRFFEEAAPKAVENFVTHAKDGYYDGVKFHRIMEDVMIQGGDPTGTGMGGESIWDKDFKDEFTPQLQPYRGALCMANAGADTNGSQFLLVQAEKTYNKEILSQIEGQYEIRFNDKAERLYGEVGGAPWLYRRHTVFGQIYDGYDVLDAINKVPKTDQEMGVPAVDVVIETVKIFEY